MDDVNESKTQRLTEMLKQAIQNLQKQAASTTATATAAPGPDDYSRWARVVVASMTKPGRVYHDIDHVFQVAENFSNILLQTQQHRQDHRAIGNLAAIFHDVIYLTIDDRQLSAEEQELLQPHVQDPGDKTYIFYGQYQQLAHDASVDSLVAMSRSLFEFYPERTLVGMEETKTNEYLSALVAVKLFHSVLSKQHLLQLLACIEASIPFRRPVTGILSSHENEDSRHCALSSTPSMEALYQRLLRVSQDFQVGMKQDQVVEMTQLAACFANADLGAFCAPFSEFLESTWTLLPEWNPVLLLIEQQDEPLVTLKHLEQALIGLLERYQRLLEIATDSNDVTIFQCFRGQPANVEAMQQRATKNIECVGKYVQVRLFCILVIQDALLLMMAKTTAELPSNSSVDLMVQEAKPAINIGGVQVPFLQHVEAGVDRSTGSAPAWLSGDDEVYQSLTSSRRCRRSLRWDAAEETNASAVLFKCMEWETIAAAVSGRQQNKKVGGGDLLRLVPEPARTAIAKSIIAALPTICAAPLHKALDRL